MAKLFKHGKEAREALANGIEQVSNVVSQTLGPAGRLVLMQKPMGHPSILTKDGVSVAKEIVLEDVFENEGAKLCIQVASKTNTVAGDGTTTATLLAHNIVKEGLRYVAAGGNPVEVKKGIEYATEAVKDYLVSIKIDITSDDEVRNIATISGNDPDVGRTVGDAFKAVGKSGVVSLIHSKTSKTSLEIVDGLKFERGWLNEYFVRDYNRMRTELENPHILLWGDRITDMKEVATLAQALVNSFGADPILLICDDLADNALSTIILNNAQGVTNIIAMKTPGFGERKDNLMQDLGMMIGATYFEPKLGRKLSSVKPSELGLANKVTLTRDETSFVINDKENPRLQDHLTSLKSMIEESDSDYDKSMYKERYAKLTQGVALISLGASTDAELLELRDRYEDAINSTKAALEEGVVPGGGLALFNSSKSLTPPDSLTTDELAGWNALRKALQAPMKAIVNNAGFNGDIVCGSLSGNCIDKDDIIAVHYGDTEAKYGFQNRGYNAKTMKYADLIEEGIIDPVKVTRSALEYAASIACLVLTTEVLIVNEKEERKPDYSQLG